MSNELRPTQAQIIAFCHSNTIIDTLGVEIIPHKDSARLELVIEKRHTNFCDIHLDSVVNIEFDILGKYIARLQTL